MNSTPRTDLKAVKVSIQATKKTWFCIESPLDSDNDLDAPENPQSQRTTVPVLKVKKFAELMDDANLNIGRIRATFHRYEWLPQVLDMNMSHSSQDEDGGEF